MIKNGEYVRKIDERLVKKNCVQIMEAFDNDLTIISKDGLLFHHSNVGQVNEYINDYRKHKFPYSNIPMHHSFSVLHGKFTYVNQLFDYNKSYFIFKDKTITENIIFKSKGITKKFEKRINPSVQKFDACDINFDIMMKDFITMYDQTYFLLSSGEFLVGFDSLIHEKNDDIEFLKNVIKNYKEIIWKVTNYYGSLFIEGLRIIDNNKAESYRVYETNLEDYNLDSIKCLSDIKIPSIRPFLNPEISKEKIKKANQKIKKLKAV